VTKPVTIPSPDTIIGNLVISIMAILLLRLALGVKAVKSRETYLLNNTLDII
jgi:hypothetical protein